MLSVCEETTIVTALDTAILDGPTEAQRRAMRDLGYELVAASFDPSPAVAVCALQLLRGAHQSIAALNS